MKFIFFRIPSDLPPGDDHLCVCIMFILNAKFMTFTTKFVIFTTKIIILYYKIHHF